MADELYAHLQKVKEEHDTFTQKMTERQDKLKAKDVDYINQEAKRLITDALRMPSISCTPHGIRLQWYDTEGTEDLFHAAVEAHCGLLSAGEFYQYTVPQYPAMEMLHARDIYIMYITMTDKQGEREI